jgi:hypothetical protein
VVERPADLHSYLPLDEIITFLTSHRDLLRIFRTSSSPLPSAIHSLLLSNSPYPSILAHLPLCSLYLPVNPHDAAHIFLELLVRARPKWILKSLEYGKWGDWIWKEAFEQRFLVSWRKYKEGEASWRGAFLDVLWRLELRNTGSSHLDRWTVGEYAFIADCSDSSRYIGMGRLPSTGCIPPCSTRTRYTMSSSIRTTFPAYRHRFACWCTCKMSGSSY